MTELTPSPTVVADLLIRMTSLDWPTSEADRRRYFDLLGLHDLDTVPQRDDEPDATMIRFATPLPAVQGTCTVFREEVLGLGLFCYDEAREDGPEARAGYAGLRNQLSNHLEPPMEEWGTPTEPACCWRSGPLMIDMYCFQRLRSQIMVGASHVARSAAHKAAQDAPTFGLVTNRPLKG